MLSCSRTPWSTAELWGHASHGMLRLPWYVARLRSGAMAGSPGSSASATPVRWWCSTAIRHRPGDHRPRDLAGVERAREYGVSAIGVRNSGHFGTAAYFTRKAADQGCVALLCTNASPAMAPWGGRHKSIGTNPWSIAAPAGRHGTVVMDLANTAVARGKVYLAAERGTEIPEGWAADAEGNPTTDPRRAIEGLILPMAGPKGYVMSFMFDVLAGVLTGSAFGADVAGPYQPDAPSGVGHLLLTIDVAAMDDPASYAAGRSPGRTSTGSPRRPPGRTDPRSGRAGRPEPRRAHRHRHHPDRHHLDQPDPLGAETHVDLTHPRRNSPHDQPHRLLPGGPWTSRRLRRRDPAGRALVHRRAGLPVLRRQPGP